MTTHTVSKLKHGCCVDKACRASTCMQLPEGKTCGHCSNFQRCLAFVGVAASDTVCDWFPRRFHAAPDPSASGVKG